MNIFKTRFLGALLLAGAMGACTVGDTVDSDTVPAADGGNLPGDPDGATATELKWTEAADAITGIKAAMHYVSASEIYAVIGTKVCVWDGTEWKAHTLDVDGLAAAMQFISPTQIYAVIGLKVCVWSGVLGQGGAWTAVSKIDSGPLNDGLGTAEFHWVADNQIYAVLNDKICMWDGAGWVPKTDAMLELKRSMHYVGPNEYYAVIGTKICKWTGILGQGGAWTAISPDQPGLKPAIQVVSDTEMYAVIGDKICMWNGTAWVKVTEDSVGILSEFARTGADDIIAITGTTVTHWAPTAI